MSEWMTCNTCYRVVAVNPTGICLSCQGGFTNQMCEDDYFYQTPKIHELKEKINAIEERLQQKDNQSEHQD